MSADNRKAPPSWLWEIVVITLVSWIACFFVFFYAIFWPVSVLEVEPNSVITAAPRIKQGDNISVAFKACKIRDATGTISINMIGESIWTLAPIPTNIPVGCYDTKLFLGTIPSAAPPGEYKIILNYHYVVNAFHDVAYHFETNRFTIESAEDLQRTLTIPR